MEICLGDRKLKFEASVLPHLDAAYNFARWLTRNDHDAEDVVQEAFLRAYRYFDGLRGDSRAWFFSTILEIVNPINRMAASMRKDILMITSVLRLKFTFLNNQKPCFISSPISQVPEYYLILIKKSDHSAKGKKWSEWYSVFKILSFRDHNDNTSN